ncbi:hypothetical protein [Clostridium baratii]
MKISGTVDTSKEGVYKFFYFLIIS